jgi:hypothetical protein
MYFIVPYCPTLYTQQSQLIRLYNTIKMLNRLLTTTLKFFFHPGYPGTRKLVLPVCPPSLISTYY